MEESATSDQTVAQLVAGVISLTDFEVRYRLVSDPPRTIPWTEWVPVTTLDARLVGSDLYPIDLNQLADDLRDLHEWTGNAVRDVLDELRAVSAWASNQELANFSDKQQLRTELRSESDGITAAYTDAITVATGPTSALSQRITTLEAEVPTLASAEAVAALGARVATAEDGIVSNADAITSLTTTVAGKADASTVSALSSTVSDQGDVITSQGDAITALQNAVNDPSTGLEATADAVSSLGTTVTSQGDDITANASAITALQASYGDVSADALFKAETYTSPGDGWARIGLQTRVSTGDDYATASIFLDSKSDGSSRIVLDASELFFGDLSSGDVINPLVYSSGVWAMNVANIGTVTAGKLQSVDGKFVIDLDNKFWKMVF
jgi:hypothetical protein